MPLLFVLLLLLSVSFNAGFFVLLVVFLAVALVVCIHLIIYVGGCEEVRWYLEILQPNVQIIVRSGAGGVPE